jgi:hypothetical protein
MENNTSQNRFSKSEAIKFGWQLATKNIWFLVGLLLIPGIINLLFSFTPQVFDENLNFSFVGLLFLIVGTIIGLQFSFAQFAVFFKLADQKKSSLKELFAYFDVVLLWRFFLVNFLFGLITTLGFLLLIIPGIYFSLKYWFAVYIFVDKRTGVIEAFKESARITKGVKWQLLLLGILQTLIMLAGALALLVGLFVAVPINYLSDVYVYRKLSGQELKLPAK